MKQTSLGDSISGRWTSSSWSSVLPQNFDW